MSAASVYTRGSVASEHRELTEDDLTLMKDCTFSSIISRYKRGGELSRGV